MTLVGEKVSVRGMMSATVEVPFTAEIDMEEFLEWSDGDDVDTGLALYYLESDRNYPDNLKIEPLSGIHTVVGQDIDRVTL